MIVSDTVAEMLTIEKFTTWLNEMPSEDNIGISCNKLRCPLANYLKEFFTPDDFVVDVGRSTIRIVDKESNLYHSVPTPYWADQFIYLVDCNGNQMITALECLEFAGLAKGIVNYEPEHRFT